jgi:uncharacterized membrane protein YgaE (UPF0421/DUF939 family)
MKFGARVLKTGIAVIFALLLCQHMGVSTPAIAAIAAAAAVQPSVSRSLTQLKDQLIAQLIGAFFAISAIHFFSYQPILVGLVVILVIAISLSLKLDSTVHLSMVTVISIMQSTQGNYLEFAFGRLGLVLLGICVATIVNLFFLPPNHESKLEKKIKTLSQKSMGLMRNMLHSEYQFNAFRKEKNEILKEYTELESIYNFYREQRPRVRRRTILQMREMHIYQKLKLMIRDQTQIVQTYREMFFVFEGRDELRELYQDSIGSLIFYQELILLKYDEKINARFDEGSAVLAKTAIRTLQEEISSKKVDEILPLLGQLAAYMRDLSVLDRRISRHMIYKKSKKEDK